MAAPKYLKKAPIREAILDIRVKLPVNTESVKLLAIQPKIEDRYPNRQVQWKGQFQIQLDKPDLEAASIARAVNGYMYRSADDKQIVQYRLDGFTFNRMQPYDKWETLRDEGRRLWEFYCEAMSPETTTRVALRYINFLELPTPVHEFAEYLTSPPVVPANLPQGVSSFLTRIVINEPTQGVAAVITQALEKIIKPDIVPIILDIDAIKEGPFGPDSPEIWETFERLRIFKNQVFFESVTEKALELFQ